MAQTGLSDEKNQRLNISLDCPFNSAWKEKISGENLGYNQYSLIGGVKVKFHFHITYIYSKLYCTVYSFSNDVQFF